MFQQLFSDFRPSVVGQKAKPVSFYFIKCNKIFGSSDALSAFEYVINAYQTIL